MQQGSPLSIESDGATGMSPGEITKAAVLGAYLFRRILFHFRLWNLTPFGSHEKPVFPTAKEYDEATEIAPNLVQKETPFFVFLQTERFDPGCAARRLVLYWKFRKEVFRERWLFPMNQTGAGAMTAEDVTILRTGFLVALARPDQGPILLCDMSKVHQTLGDAVVRIAYYLVSTCTDGLAQKEGLTILHVVTSAPRPPVETDPTPWQMILDGLPVRIKQLLVVQSVEEGREHLIDSLAYQQARVTEFCTGLTIERLASHSTESTLELLQRRGVTPRYTPKCLGGVYDYDRFSEWNRSRLLMEDSAPIHPCRPVQRNLIPAVPVAFLSAPSRIPSEAAAAAAAVVDKEETNDSNSPHDRDYRRKRNAMYVRRFYQKQNLATTTLQEHIAVLQGRNEALRKDNARLEDLLRRVETLKQGRGALKEDRM